MDVINIKHLLKLLFLFSLLVFLDSFLSNRLNSLSPIYRSKPPLKKLINRTRELFDENFILCYRLGGNEPDLADGIELAKMIVDEWLNAEYEGGRHQVRIDMIKDIEEKQKQK
jgi:hypothetical protein